MTTAPASPTGYGRARARLETSHSTVASAPTRMSNRRKRCCGVKRLDLEDHAVARGLDLGPQLLGQVGGQLPRMSPPHGHPEVGEDGEPRLRIFDDSLGVVDAEMR